MYMLYKSFKHMSIIYIKYIIDIVYQRMNKPNIHNK